MYIHLTAFQGEGMAVSGLRGQRTVRIFDEQEVGVAGTPVWGLYQFPVAAETNYHKLVV